ASETRLRSRSLKHPSSTPDAPKHRPRLSVSFRPLDRGISMSKGWRTMTASEAMELALVAQRTVIDGPQTVTAAPKSIWYHGTSLKNLQSIMSQGLIPEGTEKVWADDPSAGISAPSRQSYGGCYDDPTSILTKQRGFQHFYDLLPDDEVATLVDGRELVYEKPLAFTRYWYEGPMYAFKTRLIDQLITPDHKVYWRNRISNVKRLQLGQSETDFQLSEVSSLIGSAEVKSCGLGRN